MYKVFRLIGLLVFSSLIFAASVLANNCIQCHSKIPPSEIVHPSHSFSEWQESVHAQKGISCDACHNGDPSATEANQAHKGLAKSTDPGSQIYFDKLPETCGNCHSRELAGFKQSVHYKELTRSGKGPNCVTCHGSMATKIINPKDMDSLCTICHRKPSQAYISLINIQSSRKLLDQLFKDVENMKLERIDVSGQTTVLEQGEKSYKEIIQIWHSFDMVKVLEQTRNVNQKIRNALHELELKRKSKN